MLNFKSQVTQKVLDYYFINQNKAHHINELAKLLDIDPGNLFRKLKELEILGVLSSVSRGNQKVFTLNKKFPLLNEYQKIYENTWGLPVVLKKELQKIIGLQEAYIFGSYVKGNFQEHSDIDLLLVGDYDHGAIFKVTSPLEKKLGREINVIDFSSAEFAAKKKTKDEFVTQVLKGKIIKLV